VYCGLFEDGEMGGVAAHYWTGLVVVQAPRRAGELACACVDASGRTIGGLAGPAAQVPIARAALGLDLAATKVDGVDWMYGLDLADLVVPGALTRGDVICRAPQPGERERLCEWRMAYDIELLGAADTPDARRHSAAFLDRQMAESNAWVLLDRGQLVSLSAFNATLPDMVQLGGIYTPPALRGRGYAKAAVAGSLLAARARGATRAVLFTSTASAARSYEGIGFRRTGDYTLVLFR
jgi:GNAT superfamily N-acetyltransferase